MVDIGRGWLGFHAAIERRAKLLLRRCIYNLAGRTCEIIKRISSECVLGIAVALVWLGDTICRRDHLG